MGQKEVKTCKLQIIKQCKPITLFIIGGADTGKSQLVKTLKNF